MNRKKADLEVKSSLTRIAIVNSDRCKPKNCGQPCKKSCPVVKQGKQCIVVEPTSKIAEISEILCIGCGICVKKCPYGAIQIINLPSNLEKDTTHRYSANSFKLHRLPTPRLGSVLGLVGTNGIGKSTALKILANKLKPNLGNFKNTPDWPTILNYFRGSELQNYFTKILEEKFKAIIKPQYVDQIPRAIKEDALVSDLLKKQCQRDNLDEIVQQLELGKLLNRHVHELSGGELQRFAIAVAAVQNADIYMFDEPSSYLDVRQRLQAAKVIRDLVKDTNYVLVVEHDLAVLDYLSDLVCVLYGVPGAYGVVTLPSGVREGINIFLDGFVPTENMRFRDTSLSFKVTEQIEREEVGRAGTYSYPQMNKTLRDFKLTVEKGEFTDSEIIVLLGENGTGKTTLIRMLAGNLKPDDDEVEVPELSISYKPQKIAPKYEGTVMSLLLEKIPDMVHHPTFKTDVLNPLQMERLLDLEVQNLSGGELQRVALTMCLGKPANVYLIDEPSAYLDSEQRLHAAKVIKRHILHSKKTAFIVEHDFMMATYLADRVIVFEGEPARKAVANAPQSLLDGMNQFLRQLDITFRRDNESHRPRINKKDSVKDSEQKKSGNFFFLEDAN
ncbi:ABC transporter domain-containing protein [Ditylenchus destructor]|uniref:ABC transporter domain-containing protein n=1 Tax=Ditylenchus destructor TaxID=166010 RepID=A0AAD4NF96_9BILA|nr:ABC transporter domain-containing protein [Ditylenchus destructor]